MKKIISIIAILLLLCATTVYAVDDSFKTTLRAAPAQAKGGDTVVITIGLKDIKIQTGEKGIGAYTANVKFDPAVFEYVSTSGTTGWEAPLYQNGLITGNTQNAEVVQTPQDIATIILKVKKDAKLGETVIELTNFSGSNGLADITTSNESIKVTIVSGNTGNTGDNNNNSGSIENGNGSGTTDNGSNINNGNNNNSLSTGNNTSNNNNASNNTNIPSTSTDTSIKQETLPQTGTADVVIFTIIGVASVLAITFFIRMTVLNRKMK